MADVEQQYQQIPSDADGTEDTQQPASNLGGRWMKVGIALLGVSCLALISVSSGSGSAVTTWQADDLELVACARTRGAACAKELTELYLKERFSNNFKGLEGLLAKDAVLTVDLDDAGWLVPAKIHYAMSFKSEQDGPKGVTSFFKKLPTESDDKIPGPSDLNCKDDECVITAHVSRPFIGQITDIGTLDWDLDTKKLKKVHSKFSV